MSINKARTYLAAAVAATTLVLAAGCATKSSDNQYSGWLKDYSGMTEQKDPKGNTVMRYVSPDLTHEKYNALLIEPVTYYPEPQTTAQVSAEALDKVAAYMTSQLKQDLTAKGVSLVDAPGQGHRAGAHGYYLRRCEGGRPVCLPVHSAGLRGERRLSRRGR